jgi:imidazolonepropionase-like amidohydrolase
MHRALLLLLAIGLPVLLHGQSTGRESTIVLNHIAVIDVARSVVRPDMAIVIRGARIVAIDRPNGAGVPRDAQVLDLAGKFAIPGLVDMHNHLGSGANIPGPPVTGEAAARDPRRDLQRLLALGFTTVFATAYPNVGEFVELRKAANDDSMPLSRLFGAGRGSTVEGGHASQPRFNPFLPNTTDQARADVREMKALGVDAIKVTYSDQTHTGRTPVAVMRSELMRATIDEAHSLGLRTYVHAPTLAHAKEVLRAGADGLAHSVADAPVDDELIGLMRKNRATYTTTLALYTSFADVSAWMRRLEAIDHHHVVAPGVYERYTSVAGAQAYHNFFGTFPPQNLQHARANARRLSSAGIPVLAGTDTGVTGVLLGVSSQMELVLLVEAGLTPAEALRAATMSPARALGREKDQGTLEPGKLADLVILDADPLADIRNIVKVSRVIKGGNLYEPAQLVVDFRQARSSSQ